MRRFLNIATASLLAASALRAQQVTMDIQPRVVSMDETLNLTLTFDGANGPDVNLPELDGFQILGRGKNRNISMQGNQVQQTTALSFTLRPLKPGDFQIGPFGMQVNGKSTTIPAVTVKVVASETVGSSEQLWGAITAPAGKLYVGQAFDLTVNVYYRQDINLDRQISGNLNFPGLKTGDWQEIQTGREMVNGILYEVRRYRTTATALTAGSFKLESTLQIGVIAERSARRSQDPFFGAGFPDFFGVRDVRRADLPLKPLSLDVLPLPEAGRPAGFSGAIGRFTFTTSVNPTEVKAGEPVNVQMQIDGEGNLPYFSPPTLPVDDNFRTYEVKLLNEELDPTRTKGRRTFEQVLIPRNDSITSLPEFVFAFFNPTSGSYETIKRPPVPLTVHPSGAENTKIVSSDTGAKPAAERTLLGSDIGYLKAPPASLQQIWQPAWIAQPAVLWSQALPPLALAALYLLTRRREQLSRDVARTRRHLAPKSARAAIADAESAHARNDIVATHEAIWKALTLYFANRLNLQPGETTPDIVLSRLDRAGAPPTLTATVRDAFARCEEMRYGSTPTGDADSLRTWIISIAKLLRDCEGLRL